MGDAGKPLGVERLDHAALGHRAAEDLEFARGEVVGHIDQFHVEARVRLVDAPAVHHVLKRDARERRGDVDVERRFPDAREQSLDEGVNIFAIDERHLDVDLRELRLAVGAQIFVAIAAGQLKIFFHAGDHEDLLVLLRRLGQGVKVSRMQPAWHEEFAGAFRRALEQRWRLDLEEPLILHEHARRGGHPASQAHIVNHFRPTQVEVTVLEPQFLVDLGGDLGVVDAERQHVGVVEHLELFGHDLDEAGVDLLVLRAVGADAHLAGDADDALAVKLGGSLEQLGRQVAGVKHRLRAAFAIADVDEKHPAQVAVGMHPTVEGDGLADVFVSYFVAVMRALHWLKSG